MSYIAVAIGSAIFGTIVMALVNAGARADECAECQERQSHKCEECETWMLRMQECLDYYCNTAGEEDNNARDFIPW